MRKQSSRTRVKCLSGGGRIDICASCCASKLLTLCTTVILVEGNIVGRLGEPRQTVSETVAMNPEAEQGALALCPATQKPSNHAERSVRLWRTSDGVDGSCVARLSNNGEAVEHVAFPPTHTNRQDDLQVRVIPRPHLPPSIRSQTGKAFKTTVQGHPRMMRLPHPNPLARRTARESVRPRNQASNSGAWWTQQEGATDACHSSWHIYLSGPPGRGRERGAEQSGGRQSTETRRHGR